MSGKGPRLRETDVLRERVAAMTSDELADVLTVNPNRYGGAVLELARRELEHRGFIFKGHGDGGISTPDGITLRPRPHTPLPAVRPAARGVGGWLLLYVLSNLVCRPLTTLDGVGHSAESISEIAEGYPTTALLLGVDKALTVGLIVCGVLVSVALLKTGRAFPVKLVKLFLAVYPLVCVSVAALYGLSDFVPQYRDHLMQLSMKQAVWASAWSLVWTLYFNRSKRVRATYFPDENSPAASRP